MNYPIVIATILALLTGSAAGSVIQKHKQAEVMPVQNNTQSGYTVAPEDFVSVRPSVDSLPSETLSEDETAGLLLMREEEKLARDVYQTLYDVYKLPIFNNIAQSEQTHTEAVRTLLEKYDIADPVTDDTIGTFANSDMQSLYNELIEQGLQSETEALIVGATVEDLDIKDLAELMETADNEDILLVYDNLQRGSRNHLRAFTKQLNQRGAEYTPTYISEAVYDEILGSDQERGASGDNQNRGWGGNKNR